MDSLKKTPLYDWHLAHKAKMVDFAGYAMPVQYSAGIIAEHEHTRSAASLFDICHMGEFLVEGSGARQALNFVLTHNLDTLGVGKCRYGFLLNDAGGILDDLIVYALAEDRYMLVVNGACEESDFTWIKKNLSGDVTIENVSNSTAKIDLQGPKSCEALEQVLGGSWSHLKYFNFTETSFDGAPLTVSRTGYTGELGYELYLPANKALAMWERCSGVEGVAPAGFGARDTLRLELGYPLYGSDIDEEHTPAEAGYSFLLAGGKDFIGKKGAWNVKENLVGLMLDGRRSARHGDEVCTVSGKPVGRVTSGSFGPSLERAVALAYVSAEVSEVKSFVIKTARAELSARTKDLPFYEKGTARMKLG